MKFDTNIKRVNRKFDNQNGIDPPPISLTTHIKINFSIHIYCDSMVGIKDSTNSNIKFLLILFFNYLTI